MAHKYNKITKEQVLEVFNEKPMVRRVDITEKFNCSVYSVRREIDELVDDKIIRLSRYGYVKI